MESWSTKGISGHAGIAGDEARRVENLGIVADDPRLALCGRCHGTGNELYAMYRQCPECGGFGVVEAEG
jgi:hypothetical protein